MKKALIFFIASLTLLLMMPRLALAKNILNYQPSVTVSSSETINDNFVRFGNNIIIDGNVQGDVIVGGNSIIINGTVAGDVLAVGQNIEINGPVSGNVRVAATNVDLNNTVGKNVNIAAQTASLSDKANVGWTLAFGVMNISVKSRVGGNIYGYAQQANLNGKVGNNVTLFLGQAGQAQFMSQALINGNFTYTGNKTPLIRTGAVIKGSTVHKLVPIEVLKSRKFLSTSWIYFRLIYLFGLLLVGTIIISLLKKTAFRLTDKMYHEPAKTILLGLVYVIIAPLIFIVVALTIIGIPLALISLGIYLILIYLSSLAVGTWLGQWLLGNYRQNNLAEKKEPSLIWAMMLGTTIIYLLKQLPYLGPLIGLISVAWLFGALGELIKKGNNQPRI